MERIVQLREDEYKKLCELAKMSESEIEKKAQELYKGKGMYGINLNINCGRSEYSDTIKFYVDSYVEDWHSFPLTEGEKKKVSRFVCNRVREMMVDKFGTQIDNLNYYENRRRILERRHSIFVGVTILGWLCAVGLVVMSVVL
nr:MAG TPA: hypothetical protein [Caudoviricetes sp.]